MSFSKHPIVQLLEAALTITGFYISTKIQWRLQTYCHAITGGGRYYVNVTDSELLWNTKCFRSPVCSCLGV